MTSQFWHAEAGYVAGAVATGTWMLTGTAPCDGVTGSFTMTQKS